MARQTVDLPPLTDAELDALNTSAATDYARHEVTSMLPRRLLQLIAEVRAARAELAEMRASIEDWRRWMH